MLYMTSHSLPGCLPDSELDIWTDWEQARVALLSDIDADLEYWKEGEWQVNNTFDQARRRIDLLSVCLDLVRSWDTGTLSGVNDGTTNYTLESLESGYVYVNATQYANGEIDWDWTADITLADAIFHSDATGMGVYVSCYLSKVEVPKHLITDLDQPVTSPKTEIENFIREHYLDTIFDHNESLNGHFRLAKLSEVKSA